LFPLSNWSSCPANFGCYRYCSNCSHPHYLISWPLRGSDFCVVFSQSTDGNAGLLKKTLTDTPKHVSPAIWASIGGLVNKLCPTLTTPWTVARRAPLSMRFSRQEYWIGLPFSSGIFQNQRSNLSLLHWKAVSCIVGVFFTD